MISVGDKVLPKDAIEAEKLNACAMYCLHQARNAFMNGKFKEADMLVNDYLKTKRDLDKLVDHKEEHDRVVNLVTSLQNRGVQITIVQNLIVREGR